MNFAELLDQYHITQAPSGHEHTRPGWIQIDCPFCSRDSGRFRLGYNVEYNYANCWSCGHHSVYNLVIQLLRIHSRQAKELLKDIRPTRVERMVTVGTYTEPSAVVGLLGPHKRYLQQRGFNCTEIERLWHVRALGIAPRLSWRLFIPIEYHGKPVSWTTRKLSDDPERKYLTAELHEESLHHKHLLYGEDYCRHAIVVVEGPADVWGGGPGFAATFGLGYTNTQVARIAKYPIRAICFDNEPQAQQTAKGLAERLSCLPGQTYNITLDSKDPGEAKASEIKRIRKEILE